MGNSLSILIPKPILAQAGLESTADLQVKDDMIEIHPAHASPRQGWTADAQRVADTGNDALDWPELVNMSDADLVW